MGFREGSLFMRWGAHLRGGGVVRPAYLWGDENFGRLAKGGAENFGCIAKGGGQFFLTFQSS